MDTKKLEEKLGLKQIAGNDEIKKVSGMYICDLLSLVMSRARNNDVWVTVQTNINIVAVAHLTEVSCIIIPENIAVDNNTIVKANDEGILIYQSDKTAYELAAAFSKI